jgi:hypothetical protein
MAYPGNSQSIESRNAYFPSFGKDNRSNQNCHPASPANALILWIAYMYRQPRRV